MKPRPNDATHPRELPNLADELAYFTATQARGEKIDAVAQATRRADDLCARCREPREPADQLEPLVVSSRFEPGQPVIVRTTRSVPNYRATFVREEHNPDGALNGVALVRIDDHVDRTLVGLEIHVGVSILAPA